MTTTLQRNDRKTFDGVVVSDKMDKTRVISIALAKRDQKYGKILHRTTKVLAHDEKNETHKGDKVKIMSTRQFSKRKTWRIVSISK